MATYRVTLVYQNIESCGSRRLTSTYILEASSSDEAKAKGIRRLGCNRDGKLFSVSVARLSAGEAVRQQKAHLARNRRIGVGIPCSED